MSDAVTHDMFDIVNVICSVGLFILGWGAYVKYTQPKELENLHAILLNCKIQINNKHYKNNFTNGNSKEELIQRLRTSDYEWMHLIDLIHKVESEFNSHIMLNDETVPLSNFGWKMVDAILEDIRDRTYTDIEEKVISPMTTSLFFSYHKNFTDKTIAYVNAQYELFIKYKLKYKRDREL